ALPVVALVSPVLSLAVPLTVPPEPLRLAALPVERSLVAWSATPATEELVGRRQRGNGGSFGAPAARGPAVAGHPRAGERGHDRVFVLLPRARDDPGLLRAVLRRQADLQLLPRRRRPGRFTSRRPGEDPRVHRILHRPPGRKRRAADGQRPVAGADKGRGRD